MSNGYEAVPVAVFDGDLVGALLDRVGRLPAAIYRPVERQVASVPPGQRVSVTPGARPGSYRLHNGRLHRVECEEMVDVHDTVDPTKRARIVGMMAIRDYTRGLLEAQLSDAADASLARIRATLNGVYDRFVAKLGYVSSRANGLAFRRDPDYPLLLSLEHHDEDSGKASPTSTLAGQVS